MRIHDPVESKKFKVIVNYFFEDYYAFNPEHGSSLGLTRHGGELKDYSDSAKLKEETKAREYFSQLSLIKPELLTLDEEVDYHLLKNKQELFLFLRKKMPDIRKNDIGQYTEIGSLVSILRNNVDQAVQAGLLKSRLEKFATRLHQGQENLETPPLLWLEDALKNIPFQKQFIQSLQNIAFIKEKLSQENYQSFLKILSDTLASYDQFAHFLQQKIYQKEYSTDFAIGKEAFEKILLKEHFLTVSTEELLATGENAFNDILERLTALTQKISPSQTVYGLLQEIQSDIPEKDQLLTLYTEAVERLKSRLIEKDFVVMSEQTVMVVPTPEHFRSLIPFAAYSALGPYAQNPTYEFWVTPVEAQDEETEQKLLQSHCKDILNIIAAHECYPGHHLQISYANQLTVGTAVRKDTFNTMFLEGWALYCEQLLEELGFYAPKEKFMMLYNRLWRALRIILDVKLHTGQISFEDAVTEMHQKLNMPVAHARAEVLRYTMSPTQPSSYEVGRQIINQIRDQQKTLRGDSFDLKAFHTKLLSFGSIPVALIQKYFV